MHEKRVIIFNFDGIWIDSTDVIIRMIKIALDHVGLFLSSSLTQTLKRNKGKSLSTISQLIQENTEASTKTMKSFQEKFEQTRKTFNHARFYEKNSILYSTVFQIVRDRNIQVGLFSWRERNELLSICEQIEIEPNLFSYYFFYNSDSEIFDPIIERAKQMSHNLEDIIFVGDTVNCYLAAQRKGIDFIAVLSGACSRIEFRKVELSNDQIVERSDLPNYLAKFFHLTQTPVSNGARQMIGA